MKNIFQTIMLMFIFFSCSEGENPISENQDVRYFRFKSCPENAHGNWQDTSFIAATRRPDVIAKCLSQLALASDSRTLFPLGPLVTGSGGYNFNASHEFSWHLNENEWDLVDVGIEIYDGCAYTDAELANFVDNPGGYGGWGNTIQEEVFPN